MTGAPALCVLGSGSRGNAALVRSAARPERVVMIDCGFSPRETKRRLELVGTEIEAVEDVVLTHLDADHFNVGWAASLRKRPRRVHVHRRHRARALASGVPGGCLHLFDDAFAPLDDVRFDPVLMAHDALGVVAFVVEIDGRRLGYATDLGRPHAGLLAAFRGLDALAIESNYDPDLQRTSGRPDFLIRRIMGGAGHLSNAQAANVVRTVAEQSALGAVVALHLSQQCNRPELVAAALADALPVGAPSLVVSDQRTPTAWITIDPRSSAHLVPGGLF